MKEGDTIVKDPKEIGAFIKKERKAANVTQDELANFAGLSRIGVVKLEKEEGDIKLSTLIKVLSLLGHDIVFKKRSGK
jgi:transcriptional regulator with XRE-family HTH domain